MVSKKANTPPLMYMLINTENKSIVQLEEEIKQRVEDEISKKIYRVRREASESDSKIIESHLLKEQERIINQFLFQIRNMEEINRLTHKEVENAM